jgi:iron complex outermembrane receptor protein
MSGLQVIGNLYTKVLPVNEMVSESFSNLTAKISYRPARQITVFLSGDNLLNQEYQLQYGYPMPGTTFLTGMNINF